MQILKVLNNSLLLAVDNNGSEVVLMGKGIGFNKSIGHRITDSDIQKVFILKERMVLKNIIQLANEIDVEYFEIAKIIIDYAISKYNMNLMEYIYLSLTDHIVQTVKRIQLGISIPNLYNVFIKQLNIEEYKVGEFAIELIKEKIDVVIPEEEIGNIAIHFINAQKDNIYKDKDREISSFVNSILKIVKHHFMCEYDVQSIAYNRFVIHLQLFSTRLLYNSMNKDNVDQEFYKMVSDRYPKSKVCADKIKKFINNSYNIQISQQEKIYLTIHIQKIIEELGRG